MPPTASKAHRARGQWSWPSLGVRDPRRAAEFAPDDDTQLFEQAAFVDVLNLRLTGRTSCDRVQTLRYGPRHQLTKLSAGNRRRDGLEWAANLVRSLDLDIPHVLLRETAPEEQQDDPFCVPMAAYCCRQAARPTRRLTERGTYRRCPPATRPRRPRKPHRGKSGTRTQASKPKNGSKHGSTADRIGAWKHPLADFEKLGATKHFDRCRGRAS